MAICRSLLHARISRFTERAIQSLSRMSDLRPKMKKGADPATRANAHRLSFLDHDSYAPISVLALGERGSPLTMGKQR
jgi:hypothetical protein